MKKHFSLLIVMFSLLVIQWGSSPSDNVQVTWGPGSYSTYEYNSLVLSSGEIIVTYSLDGCIWAQKLSPEGTPIWGPKGKLINANSKYQLFPKIVTDGQGGAVIAWLDYNFWTMARTISAQRIDYEGSILWDSKGIRVTNKSFIWTSGSYFAMQPDMMGGAYISFLDSNSLSTRSNETKLYLQRLNSEGNRIFGDSGMQVLTEGIYQHTTDACMLSDGESGVMIAWRDSKDGNPELLAQRINHRGEKLWGDSGTVICPPLPGRRYVLEVISNGESGIIILWSSYGTKEDTYEIYAQNVKSDGQVKWDAEGRYVGMATLGWWFWPRMVEDGEKGAVFTWNGNEGILAQRLDQDGNRLWDMNGVRLSDQKPIHGCYPRVESFNNGKFLLIWSKIIGLYGTIIDLDGNIVTEEQELTISEGLANYTYDPTPIQDGTGIVIFFDATLLNQAWWANSKIYAQRVLPDGNLGFIKR